MSLFSEAFQSALPSLLEVHGEEITYNTRPGESFALVGILNFGEEVQADRAYMTFWAPLASFTAGEPRKGDTVTIDGALYRVADVITDNVHGRLLRLVVNGL